MAAQKLVLCDTNVLIGFYKNDPTVIDQLKKIGQANIAISIITASELIYGALNKKELSQILKDISHLSLFEIDTNVCKIFLELITDYSLSHKLTIPDALIAATAIYNEIPLYTLNIKDFKFIHGLRLYM